MNTTTLPLNGVYETPAARHDNGPAEPAEAGTEPVTIDTLIVSDIHLGSEVCRAGALLSTLKRYRFRRLILNGDVFDDLNFTRLTKEDWKVLSTLRRLSNPKRGVEVVWVAGNHDGVAEILSHLLGVQVYEEYRWTHCGTRFLAMHGHQFDNYITQRERLTAVASYIYLKLQKIDGERQRLSRWIKRTSKSWLRVADTVGRDALDYALTTAADVVFCGHTHIPGHTERNGVRYINSGCWTDRPSQYVTVGVKGDVQLHECT